MQIPAATTQGSYDVYLLIEHCVTNEGYVATLFRKHTAILCLTLETCSDNRKR